MLPHRIQRKRTKGWRMPKNTIFVGRPTKYGNPFKLVGDMVYGNASHRRKIFSPWIYIDVKPENLVLVLLYKSWIKWKDNHHIIPCPLTIQDIKKELKGKNLACWCKLSEPCHADVLLDIANA